MKQNTSHAVMAQRPSPRESLDDFPTPPWATRALMEHVIRHSVADCSCLEPACGAGHMGFALDEFFETVTMSDIADRGAGMQQDFLSTFHLPDSFDWVITNPPFNRAEPFARRAMSIAKVGVAMLVRTAFLEGVGRHTRLFKEEPPSIVAQFVERVPMVQGRLSRTASTATSYAWLVWLRPFGGTTRLIWIPPCRKRLERDSDYPIIPEATSL